MAKNLLAICLMFIVASSVVYEVQGTFLLRLYLRKKFIPRRCIDFTPFANKGMLMLVGNLERGCPATREFKEFFANFKAYMSFINSVSVSSSSNIDVEMNGKANALFKSCSVLDAMKGGRSSSMSSFKMTMLSMGKTLIEQKRRGSMMMTIQQKKELVIAMVQWTRMLATFVKAASEKSGKSIDISSYGLDVDVNQSVGSSSSSSSSKDESSSTNSGSVDESESSTKTGSVAGSKTKESSGYGSETSSKSESGPTYSDATGAKSGSPSGSPSGSASASGSGSSKTKKSSGESTYTDTTGAKSVSPSGSPTSSSSGSSKATGESSATATASGSSKSKESASGSSKTKESTAGKTYSDTTGTKAVSPTASSSGTEATKTTGSGSASSGSKESKSSSTTSLKQVETETSSEVMSFISNLEKKYTGNAELKVFFDKLKTSMSASSKISSTNAQDFVSGMKSAAGKLSEAMLFVRSRFSKSAETKTTMETCQEQVMKSLKELQEINSEIASAKTVTLTQKTELKQTITQWEQVTTQFVETAASSSKASSSSQQSSSSFKESSGSSQKTSAMNAQAS